MSGTFYPTSALSIRNTANERLLKVLGRSFSTRVNLMRIASEASMWNKICLEKRPPLFIPYIFDMPSRRKMPFTAGHSFSPY